MGANSILSDGGLVRGTQFKLVIDGYTYLFKTGSRAKPINSEFEKDENSLPLASSHARDFQKISGTVKVYAGVPEPSQLNPFIFDSRYWALGNLTLTSSTEGTREYSCDITQLAGTSAAAFTVTP